MTLEGLSPVVPVLAGAEKLNAEPEVVDVVPKPPNPPNLKKKKDHFYI